tara:strand:- start:909 stop:1730 length:822 start_codon:yes stop_codon:yes gene_type:complete
MNNVGIIGFGFVGKAVNQLNAVCETNIYDLYNNDYSTLEHKRKAYNSDIVFINVPTDLKDGRLDISILEDCIQECISHNLQLDSTIVIKSTVPVGTSRELSQYLNLTNIVFNPEFLSQRTAMQDFINEKELYLAGPKAHTSKVKRLYEEFFDYHENYDVEILETENWEEIELLKLARNTYYGLKVSYCNYLYNLCETIGIKYSSFRENFARGEWVEEQHTFVPGPDSKFGYGGKCLPKDSTELLNYCKKQDIMFVMLEESINFNALQRSKKYD